MDHELVSRVIDGVNSSLRRLGRDVGMHGRGTVDDLCDIAVARSLASALLHSGTTARDLAASAEVLRRTSDVMTFHGNHLRFETVADRLLWSYASLYLRMLALAFREVWLEVDFVAQPGEGRLVLSEQSRAALAAAASDVSPHAFDRLEHALNRSTELAGGLPLLNSPFAKESAQLLETIDAS